MPAHYVVIHLSEERPGGNAQRRIRLDEANNSCLIGRASSKGFDILAKPDNGYFENPVVSRNHAELRADFVYQRVYIKDIGSTHGTWVNNIRLPATVRHPIRTGDNLTLGVGIKAQGAEITQPTITKVGVHFGITRPFAEKGTCVFEVPDETSVEGSEPEDTLQRARRFLHALDDKRAPHRQVDLTPDTDLHPIPLDARDMPGSTQSSDDEDEEEEDSVEDELEAEDGFEDEDESDYEIEYEDEEMPSDSLFGQSEVEDNVPQVVTMQARGLEDSPRLEDSPPKEPSIHEVTGLDYSLPGPTTTTEAEVFSTLAALEGGSDSVSSGNNGFEAPYGRTVLDGPEASIAAGPSAPGPESEPEGGASSSDSDTSQLADMGAESATLTMSEGIETGDFEHPPSEGHSTVSKKRKASEISKEDEPQLSGTKKALIILHESAVQTSPLDVREPKRLRRAADIVGYAALGGLAGGLALFTTLVVSAPTFS